MKVKVIYRTGLNFHGPNAPIFHGTQDSCSSGDPQKMQKLNSSLIVLYKKVVRTT